MKKMSVLIAVALLVPGILGLNAAAAPADKVDVCHRVGDGSYILININDNAYPAHVDHGDAHPGEMVPGMERKIFGPDCSLQDALYTVTVNVQGSGSVTMDPDGGIYDPGTQVILTASANSGWWFSEWSGDLSGSSNPYTLMMNGNKSVTAIFVERP